MDGALDSFLLALILSLPAQNNYWFICKGMCPYSSSAGLSISYGLLIHLFSGEGLRGYHQESGAPLQWGGGGGSHTCTQIVIVNGGWAPISVRGRVERNRVKKN